MFNHNTFLKKLFQTEFFSTFKFSAQKTFNPCEPSPCGPYSSCRIVNNHAACSCQQNYIGSPPACKPECIVSTDCPQNKACISQRCEDPCLNTCGPGAECQVISHSPVCICPIGFTGDPFFYCVKIESMFIIAYKISNCKNLLLIFCIY